MKITRGQLRRLILEMDSREEDLIKILMEAIDLIKHVDSNDKPTVEAPLEMLDDLKNEGIITNLRFDENHYTVGPGRQFADFAVHWDFVSARARMAVMNHLMSHPQIEAIDIGRYAREIADRYYYIPRTSVYFEQNLGDRVVIYAIEPDLRVNVYVVSGDIDRYTRFFRRNSIRGYLHLHLHPSGKPWNEI